MVWVVVLCAVGCVVWVVCVLGGSDYLVLRSKVCCLQLEDRILGGRGRGV